MAIELEACEQLTDKVLSGDNGSPVPITGVDVVHKVFGKDGTETPVLQFTGEARGVLRNPGNPGDGSDPLPGVESMPTVYEQDVLSKDNTMFIRLLNQWLGLAGDDALVDDGGGWLMRFAVDGPKSVVAKIKEKGLYLKAKAKPDVAKARKWGEYEFYLNLHVPPKRDEATTNNMKALADRLKKVNAERAKAAAEKAAAEASLGGGSDALADALGLNA
jgi:hypothetical protein